MMEYDTTTGLKATLGYLMIGIVVIISLLATSEMIKLIINTASHVREINHREKFK